MAVDQQNPDKLNAVDSTVLPDPAGDGLSIIEQVHATCEKPGRPWLVGINPATLKAVLFQPRCKSWSCPVCADVNRRLWGVRAAHGFGILAEAGNLNNFLTITSHEKLSASASLAAWPDAWKKLTMRARRAVPDYQYFMIPEQHKDGRLHIHAIETANLGKRWWKDNARACGLGYMADESEVRSPAGSYTYAIKYLGKALEFTAWPRGWRRVRTSQGWPKLPEMETVPGWTWLPLTQDQKLSWTVRMLENDGYTVAMLDHVTAWQYAKENTPE